MKSLAYFSWPAYLLMAPLLLVKTEPAYGFTSPCPSYEENRNSDRDSFLDRPEAKFKEFLKLLGSPGVASKRLRADRENLPAAGKTCAMVMTCFRNNQYRLKALGHTYGEAKGAGMVPATGEAGDLVAKLDRDKIRYKNCEELLKAAQEEVENAKNWQGAVNGFRTRH